MGASLRTAHPPMEIILMKHHETLQKNLMLLAEQIALLNGEIDQHLTKIQTLEEQRTKLVRKQNRLLKTLNHSIPF